MSEIEEISARLTVLETVVRQLITHMAARSEDPPRWVETRKVLAMSAVSRQQTDAEERTEQLRDAIAGFFDQAEHVAGEYSFAAKHGTARPFGR